MAWMVSGNYSDLNTSVKNSHQSKRLLLMQTAAVSRTEVIRHYRRTEVVYLFPLKPIRR